MKTLSRFFVLALVPLLLLGACNKKSAPLKGKREPILIMAEDLVPSSSLANVPVVLSGSEHNKDWPQSGGEPDRSMPNVALGKGMSRIWSTSIGSGSGFGKRILSTPIVAKGVVYTLDGNAVVSAFDSRTGKKYWDMITSPTGKKESSIGGGLAYADGRIYVTSAFAEILCLDAKTGQIVWRHLVNSPIRAAPIYKDGRIFVVTINNHLEAVNARNGKPLWDHAGISETAGILGGAAPAIGPGIVVVPYSSGEVYGLRVENGHPLWYESLTSFRHVDSITSINHIRAQPIIDGTQAFLISHSGRMTSVDVRSGDKIWSREVGGIQAPVVSGNFVFLISTDNKLVCLTKDQGLVKWVKNLPLYKDAKKKKYRMVWSGPLLAGNRLIITGSDGKAHFYNATNGKRMGGFKLPGKTYLPPIVADKTMYILSDNGKLSAYR